MVAVEYGRNHQPRRKTKVLIKTIKILSCIHINLPLSQGIASPDSSSSAWRCAVGQRISVAFAADLDPQNAGSVIHRAGMTAGPQGW
jgi:hypothetical protein